MKHLRTLFLLIGLLVSTLGIANAKLVKIKDQGFRLYLKNWLPEAFVGKYLNTQSPSVRFIRSLYISESSTPIKSIEGIKYFVSLENLEINGQPINTIPKLPQSLINLQINNCDLSRVKPLPTKLEIINFNYNPKLAWLPKLPATLKSLSLDGSSFKSLPTLPLSLTNLSLRGIYTMYDLPVLPRRLESLDVSEMMLATLPEIPSRLTDLYIEKCPSIAFLPALPNSLRYFNARGSALIVIPTLPNGMVFADLSDLTNVRDLPAYLSQTNIEELYLDNLSLNNLPVLPSSLQVLSLSGTIVAAEIAALPTSLAYLYVDNFAAAYVQDLGIDMLNPCAKIDYTGNMYSLIDYTLPNAPIEGSLSAQIAEIIAMANMVSDLHTLPDYSDTRFDEATIEVQYFLPGNDVNTVLPYGNSFTMHQLNSVAKAA